MESKMGELILCTGMTAEHPYYIESASLHVYSIEELSYYIENNLYLLDVNFLNEKLCTWLDEELKLHEAAKRLREILQKNGTVAELVGCILTQSGYCSRETARELLRGLQEQEHKSEFERRKIRADLYMENRRYISAIREYRRLLEQEEENPILVGNIWHNLGTAYARMFFWKEAVMCYNKAYKKNGNPQSLRECLYVCYLLQDKEQIRENILAHGVSQEELAEVKRECQALGQTADMQELFRQSQALFAAADERELHRIIEDWKDTYRKNC